METTTEKTFPSEIQNLIWRENPNGPINWFLEETNRTGMTKSGCPFHKCYGDVTATWNNKYTTMLPAYYDEETDSDAYSVGEFETLEDAFRAVEKQINLSLHF